jgi:hypothetical protein
MEGNEERKKQIGRMYGAKKGIYKPNKKKVRKNGIYRLSKCVRKACNLNATEEEIRGQS